jgi:hypothetical protein
MKVNLKARKHTMNELKRSWPKLTRDDTAMHDQEEYKH